jgi:hypothetical protein
MEAQSHDASHTLFTVFPNDQRTDFTLRVTTPYLRGLVMEEIAKFDTADQISFYHRASSLPQFRGTLGYMFEECFLVWLYSAERANALSCTAESTTSANPPRATTSATSANPLRATRSTRSKSKLSNVAADEQAELRLHPLGRERLTVVNGDSSFANAKDSHTPFGWVPASRTFPTFDAVICTDKNIITIQVTVSSEHTMERDGFDRLKHRLPVKFQRTRTWCHVFVTDCPEKADSLRKQHHQVAKDMNISIYSAVLDVY